MSLDSAPTSGPLQKEKEEIGSMEFIPCDFFREGTAVLRPTIPRLTTNMASREARRAGYRGRFSHNGRDFSQPLGGQGQLGRALFSRFLRRQWKLWDPVPCLSSVVQRNVRRASVVRKTPPWIRLRSMKH